MSHHWMPLYVADYAGDTGHLTTLEHGAYMLLIMHYWAKNGLPNNDAQLARIARMPLDGWMEIKPTIRALFLDGWKHKRIEFELTETARKSEQAKRAAEASWEARKQKNAAPRDADACADRLRLQPQPQSQDKDQESLEDAALRAPPPKREKPALRKGSRLPETWEPSASDIEFAEREGLRGEDRRREIVKFRNYWTSKAGQGATKLDWSRTWANWVLKARENRNGAFQVHAGGSPRRGSRDDIRERTVVALDQLKEFSEGRSHSDGSSNCGQTGPPLIGWLPKLGGT